MLPKTTNMHSLPQYWVRGPLPQMSQFRPNLSRGRKMRSLVSKRGKKTLEGECRCSSYISRTIEPILRHQISTNFFTTFTNSSLKLIKKQGSFHQIQPKNPFSPLHSQISVLFKKTHFFFLQLPSAWQPFYLQATRKPYTPRQCLHQKFKSGKKPSPSARLLHHNSQLLRRKKVMRKRRWLVRGSLTVTK